ncbi:MAG TPA: hypothetical protein VM370_13830 [Candidatus Thermoplasmatota archaeon]|nr:hypothetical protein [Candidatus Thermoplasmatota archaeon]
MRALVLTLALLGLAAAPTVGATASCSSTGGFHVEVPNTDVSITVYQGAYPVSVIVDLGNDNDICSDQTIDSLGLPPLPVLP